jgi:hypothetical protein
MGQRGSPARTQAQEARVLTVAGLTEGLAE